MVNIVLVRFVKAALLYFALVFGAGLVLGPIRILWVVPRFGTRMAELMEAPIMLVVIIFAARWIVRRLALPPTPSVRLGVGCIALGFMLIAEFMLAVWLRGLSMRVSTLPAGIPCRERYTTCYLGCSPSCLFSWPGR
jgi:hypothetical protein